MSTEMSNDCKPFLFWNGQMRKPDFGSNKWEYLLTFVTLFLFTLSFVEIVALAQYASVFSLGTAEGCCGVIEESSWSFAGAVCFEEDIVDSRIERVTVDGSVMCMVAGEICDSFEFRKQGNETSLEECASYGNYSLTEVCSEEAITADVDDENFKTMLACLLLCLVIFGITFVGLSEYIGCFDDSTWCQRKPVQVGNKVLEILIWCCLLIIQNYMIENPAGNGYRVQKPPNSEARKFMYDTCEFERQSYLWIDLELDVPEWLQSQFYTSLAFVGVIMSVVEFGLYFLVFHFQRVKALKVKRASKLEKTVELGGAGEKVLSSSSGKTETLRLDDTGTSATGGDNTLRIEANATPQSGEVTATPQSEEVNATPLSDDVQSADVNATPQSADVEIDLEMLEMASAALDSQDDGSVDDANKAEDAEVPSDGKDFSKEYH